MALLAIHNLGTVAVANGGTTVTGTSTNWVAAQIRAGDIFARADFSAMAMITADPTSPTSLTIEAWPGATLGAGSNYKVIRLPDANRLSDVIMLFASTLAANVSALGGLTGAADKAPYFTGAGTMALADLKGLARAIGGLSGSNGSFIRSTGAATAVMQAIIGTVAQSSGVATGALFEAGANANGNYVRFADGTQICAGQVALAYVNGSILSSNWTFPAAFLIGTVPSVSQTIMAGSGTQTPSLNQMGLVCLGSTSHLTAGLQLRNVNGQTTFGSGDTINTKTIAVGRWF